MNKSKLLIKQIEYSLRKIHDNGNYKTQYEWTTAFKKTLYNLGKKKYEVYPIKKKRGAWLFDLCWAKGENCRTDFKGLKLACEIEWSRNINAILYDFQKLTIVDSDIRLMIFQYDYEDEFNVFFSKIMKASKRSKQKGYKYIIAASGNNGDEMKFKYL